MFTHLLLGFGLSFIGSLPFGMINMAVAHTGIRKGISQALWVAAGAAFVEMFQVFAALKFTWLFTENPLIEKIFQIIAAILFLGGGIYFFFFAKPKSPAASIEPPGKRRFELLKGMFLSSVNLMVFPYWIFYGTLLTTHDLLKKENIYIWIFSIGTMLGAFALLCIYALLGAKILRKSEQITQWVNKFIGLVLVGFGVFQLWKLIQH